MAKTIKVSVLMPAYNSGEFIAEAIESILAQSYQNIELLISDDASIDNTLSVANYYAGLDHRISVYKQEQNIGVVGNKNFLLNLAIGDYICWQDSDDISYPRRIQDQLNAISEHKVEIVASNLDRIKLNKGRWDTVATTSLGSSYLITEPPEEYPFMFATLLFSKQLAASQGMFNPYFNHLIGEDYYWTMRANSSSPIYFINEALYGYRMNNHSATNSYNERKLIIPEVLRLLTREYKTNGTNCLERGDSDALVKIERQLLTNKKFMAEQYRIWAAKAIDNRDFKLAEHMLKRSFFNRTISSAQFRTCFYYLRSRLTHA